MTGGATVLRRIVALAVVLALGCAIASAATQAEAAQSKTARGTSAGCIKRTPVKRMRTVPARRGRPIAKLLPGKLAASAKRRGCARRRAGSPPALPVAGRPATGDEPPTSAPAGQPAPLALDSRVPPSAPVTSTLPVASTLGVEAHDFGTFVLRLTRLAVPAGNLTIYFRNHDVSEHNLWLGGPDPTADAERISGNVAEGEGAVKTVAVTPGAWRLYCSLLGHSSMDRTLIVT